MRFLQGISNPEIIAIAGMTALTLVAVIYLIWLVRTSGRDQIDDPELVERFIREAPYERLKEVLSPESEG